MLTLKDFNIKRKNFKTSSGINVLLLSSPNMPVYYEISFLAGSRYDLPGKDGTAHYLEHMLLAGSKNFPTKDLIAMNIEDLGGLIGATTSKNIITIHVSLGDPNDLEQSLILVSDLLNNSLFENKALEMEKNAILREIEMSKSSQGKVLGHLIPKLIFNENPISRDILGTTETLGALSKNDLLEFKEKNLLGENTSVTIAGDINENNLKILLEKYLNITQGSRKNFEEFIDFERKKFVDYAFYENENVLVSLNFTTVNMTHQDKMPLRILSAILGSGRASVLMKRLRYEKGFAYNLGTSTLSDIDYGDFEFYITLKKENIQEALDIFKEEVQKMATNGPSEDQLQFVKNRIFKSLRLRYQTCFAWVDSHSGRNVFLPDVTWNIEDNYKEIENTSIEDVKRVAKTYFTNNNWYLGMVGKIDQNFVDQIKFGFDKK